MLKARRTFPAVVPWGSNHKVGIFGYFDNHPAPVGGACRSFTLDNVFNRDPTGPPLLPAVRRGTILFECSSSPRPMLMQSVPSLTKRASCRPPFELPRRFPNITENAKARAHVRTIVGWQPPPSQPCTVTRLRPDVRESEIPSDGGATRTIISNLTRLSPL
jgi:hypothetical protein